MKSLRLLMSFSLVGLVLFALGPSARAQYPRWLHGATGFARAVELQRELNVSLVLYFYQDRCSDCRTLEEQYLAAPSVHRALQRSVAVRINPDYGIEERQIAERYGVTGYPAFLILDDESAPPRNVQPYRRDGNHLTPEQFARACEKLMTFLPIPAKVPRDASRETMDGANRRAVMNATRQTRSPQLVEVAKASSPPIESKPNPFSTIDAVLNAYVNAIGGREAQEKLKSRVIRGRIELSGAASWGQFEIYNKAPNKSLVVMNVDPMGQVKYGYDGCTAWSVGDTIGLKTLTGPALAHFSTNNDFYRDLKLQELYPGLRLMGRMNAKDRDLYLVEGFPLVGGAEIMYFDSKTGLLTGRDVTQQTPQGPIRVEMRYSDWRDVDGVKLPFKIIQTMPNLRYVFTVREIKHNLPVDDKLFEKP
ncbi:MAG: thioredoxin family protein [Pyrinomonadaceae bacterium]